MNFYRKKNIFSKNSGWILPFKRGLAGISQIFFVQSSIVGLFILLINLQNPNMAIAGFISFVSVILFAMFFGLKIEKMSQPYWIYNPLLVGLSIGCLFSLDLKVVCLIVVMSILSVFIITFLESILVSRGLPLLSLPFAIVSIFVYMVAHSYGKLFSLALFSQTEPDFVDAVPLWLASFFRAIGTIVFSPTVLTGVLIFVIILWFSRILALMSVVCFFFGVFAQSCLSDTFEAALTSTYAFNYILVGLATLTFLKASLRTYALALLSVCICVFFAAVTTRIVGVYQIPVFTLPFNISVILLMLTVRRFGYKGQNIEIRESPEESLSASLVSKQRFHTDKPVIGVPFEGQCTVYQGWNDKWTHKGSWRHAIDFIRCDENDSMFINEGRNLQDYLIFGMDVLSPVEGYVIACDDHLSDNLIGKIDHVNNWGNYIIIRSLDGVNVEISHLMHKSLLVKQGDYVNLGQVLAKCGNSGFSPVPHLHIQVQRSGYLGDETIPFSFAMYHVGDELVLRNCPARENVVEAVKYNQERAALCSMPLGKVFSFDMITPTKKVSYDFKVFRNQDLTAATYLEDNTGSRLYFGALHGSFRFYDFSGSSNSPLRLLYLAMPSLPLIKKKRFEWRESLPVGLVYGNCKSKFLLFIVSFWPFFKCPEGQWQCRGNDISGVINTGKTTLKTFLRLTQYAGIKEMSLGTITLIKKGDDYETDHTASSFAWNVDCSGATRACPVQIED